MSEDLFNFKWVFGRPDKPKLPWSKQNNTNNAQYLAIPEVTEHGCLCCRLAANTVTCRRSGNERFPRNVVSLGFAELSKVVHESKSHDSGEIGRRRTWSASSVTKPLSDILKLLLLFLVVYEDFYQRKVTKFKSNVSWYYKTSVDHRYSLYLVLELTSFRKYVVCGRIFHFGMCSGVFEKSCTIFLWLQLDRYNSGKQDIQI